MNPYEIIRHPYITEKTMVLMEKNNSLQFITKIDANKKQIKEAIEKIFAVKVESVNTRIGKKGKIATVKLKPEYRAEDVATRIGAL
ncbi:MAG: 50S ribosomal protein L23 [Thermoplasmatales archaeon]|nr:50S ribosomal protein L23 [Thermoplasmatales archaeon]